ncbi:MAG: NUDIX domain-containing protein [Magnetococcales bacterium]|nr:NUDIX domain-containing protein [Magnetococcales bacterium]
MKVDVLETRDLHQGFLKLRQFRLKYERFDGRMSREMAFEVVDRGEAVTVILYEPGADQVGLIRQFRIGAYLGENQGWCVEVVAGACDGEQDLAAVARREIQEETGWQVIDLQQVHSYYLAPGGSNERIHLFLGILAPGAPRKGGGGLEQEGEDIETLLLPFAQAWEMVFKGEINSASAILALQWLAMNRERLQKEA